MSDSRLEKFIYAICSMDVSDLPVPLSRIEKLWNCLITGEIPDFEPLSRNEKYLMAMLDRYDISNLPAPMSRVEKLLYKIAVGETDLSDVPGYLSRYEELLKYLIENGGIGFEYVLYTINQSLYTLYTTAEKPVKSAILKGQTLVNVANYSKLTIAPTNSIDLETGIITLNGIDGFSNVWIGYHQIEPSTKYLCLLKILETNGNIPYFQVVSSSQSQVVFDESWKLENPTKGLYKKIITTSSNIIEDSPIFRSYIGSGSNGSTIKYQIMCIEYQDGMENWDIPYFEGMQSVKMPVLTTTGKNLIPLKEDWVQGQIMNGGGISVNSYALRTKSKIKVKPNTKYTFSTKSSDCKIAYHEWEANGKYIKDSGWITAFPYTFTTNNKTEYINLTTRRVSNVDSTVDNLDDTLIWQLEESSTATTYEPHKSNILTVNEPVELRGIGNVKDELNISTGEKVERIGEIVLDGSQDWNSGGTANWNNGNTIGFYIKYYKTKNNIGYSDKLPLMSNIKTNDTECFYINSTQNWIGIRLLKSKLSELTDEGLKAYLQSNPVTVQYQLETESVKTVDLTVVDQDNQPTQLGTFENVTHVSLESAGLIPTVEMEVATRISKELASTSPLMDNISTKQEQLNTTVDEQSNNVDATMIATTEIYEETL